MKRDLGDEVRLEIDRKQNFKLLEGKYERSIFNIRVKVEENNPRDYFLKLDLFFDYSVTASNDINTIRELEAGDNNNYLDALDELHKAVIRDLQQYYVCRREPTGKIFIGKKNPAKIFTMKKQTVAKWLFVYFFLITGVLGIVILIFGSSLLKIDDTTGIFEIIIPTCMGQLVILVKWYSTGANSTGQNALINIPRIMVFLPPILIITLLILTFVLKIVGFYSGASWAISDSTLKIVVAFCISLLNVTTFSLVDFYFKT